MIRVFFIGTALVYGQALIGCIVPEGEGLIGEELLSVSAEFDSVPFHDAARHAMHETAAASDAEPCYLQVTYRF